MTVASNSVVIIAPQSEWTELKKFLLSQGYDLGPGNELSASGAAPATHRGGHANLTDKQAREFTLRNTPEKFDKYSLTEAQACLDCFAICEDDANIKHGVALDADRNSDLVIANTTKALSKPKARYEAVLAKRGLKKIQPEDVTPSLAESSVSEKSVVRNLATPLR